MAGRPQTALLVSLLALLGACATGERADHSRAGAAPQLTRLGTVLADLVEQLKPGLVHVDSSSRPDSSDSPAPGRPRLGVASGFIIDPEGLVVTSAHVVAGIRTTHVQLFDGRRFTADVLARDERADLAVLRIAGVRKLPALRLGDSSQVRVGEFVLALGHPFGLEHTVTFGIVSRKGESVFVAAPGMESFQTDAAINPGNSGGPLVNMAGDVIGVNSMAARNGTLGLVIPSNFVKALLSQLTTRSR